MAEGPHFSGFVKGFTVPVRHPVAVAATEGAVEPHGIAVGRTKVDGKDMILLTLRHQDGSTLTGFLDDAMMVKFTGLLLEASDEAHTLTIGKVH